MEGLQSDLMQIFKSSYHVCKNRTDTFYNYNISVSGVSENAVHGVPKRCDPSSVERHVAHHQTPDNWQHLRGPAVGSGVVGEQGGISPHSLHVGLALTTSDPHPVTHTANYSNYVAQK